MSTSFGIRENIRVRVRVIEYVGEYLLRRIPHGGSGRVRREGCDKFWYQSRPLPSTVCQRGRWASLREVDEPVNLVFPWVNPAWRSCRRALCQVKGNACVELGNPISERRGELGLA